MIKLIQGRDRSANGRYIGQMHVIRRQIFNDRLNWDVSVLGDWEIDGFDACDPLYIVSVGEDDNVRGSLRLLPTTGPNMLADVFNCLLPKKEKIKSPVIWESSRFCVSLADGQTHRSLKSINVVTAELIAAMGEVAIYSGISQVVTVYDAFLRRIICRAGCEETLVGGPINIGGVKTYAGLFDVQRPELDAFKENWGIGDDLFESTFSPESVLAA